LTPQVEVLYTESQIAKRVSELGEQVSRDYGEQPVDVVAVLDQAFIFAADLVRRIRSPVRLHFLRADTRSVAAGGQTELKEIFFWPEICAAGKNILLVEGILHTGITLDFVTRRLQLGQPQSLRTAVLLHRPEAQRVEVKPDYFGFQVASNVVVGYGLDWEGQFANLSYLATVNRPAPMIGDAQG
jgi:hypoxanthine phosphoribosyltransferase